jgi:hypothetical protein
LPGFRRNCRKPLALLQLSPSKTGILVYRSKRGNWDLIAHDRVLPPKHRHVVVGSDVLFLKLALERGMTIAAVAGFLGRDEDEVREKAEELRRRP